MKTDAVATPFLKDAVSYWPQPLRYNPMSRDAAGTAVTMLVAGGLFNFAFPQN